MQLNKALLMYEKLKAFDDKFILAGSARRNKQTDLHDLDVIYLGEEIPEIPFAESYIQKGKTKVAIMMDGEQVDIYRSEESYIGAMLFFLTGPGFFNVRMRNKAKKKGFKLNQYGIWNGEECIASKTENDMFHALGMETIEPQLRK
jgi:DNA polymerase (family 10)